MPINTIESMPLRCSSAISAKYGMGSTFVMPLPLLCLLTKVSVANLQLAEVAILPAKVTDSSSRKSPPINSIALVLEDRTLKALSTSLSSIFNGFDFLTTGPRLSVSPQAQSAGTSMVAICPGYL